MNDALRRTARILLAIGVAAGAMAATRLAISPEKPAASPGAALITAPFAG